MLELPPSSLQAPNADTFAQGFQGLSHDWRALSSAGSSVRAAREAHFCAVSPAHSHGLQDSRGPQRAQRGRFMLAFRTARCAVTVLCCAVATKLTRRPCAAQGASCAACYGMPRKRLRARCCELYVRHPPRLSLTQRAAGTTASTDSSDVPVTPLSTLRPLHAARRHQVNARCTVASALATSSTASPRWRTRFSSVPTSPWPVSASGARPLCLQYSRSLSLNCCDRCVGG